MNKSSWGSSVIFKRVKECRDHKVWANILVLYTSSSLSVKQRQDRYYRVRARIKLETVWKSPKIVTCTKQVVVILSYLFDLFIWSRGSTGKTVVAESGRLLRRLKSGNPFCFDSVFLPHYLSIFFFSVLNLKAFQLDMFSPDDERFHDLVALFTCLHVSCLLCAVYSVRQAGTDLGTENAPGVNQQRLKNALTVMVPAPGLQQYLKGTIEAMRVGLWAVVHCILHYIKCPPHNWSLVIAFLTLGSPGGSEAKNLPAAQETGVQSLVRKIAWGRECNPLQDSCLENFMDRGAWRATVHAVAKSRTWLSDSHFLTLIYLLNFSPIKNIQPPLNSKIDMGTVKSKFGVTAA